MIVREYIEDGFIIQEYPSGAVVRTPILTETPIEEPIIQPETIESRLNRIENTLDLILLKQEGIL